MTGGVNVGTEVGSTLTVTVWGWTACSVETGFDGAGAGLGVGVASPAGASDGGTTADDDASFSSCTWSVKSASSFPYKSG